MLMTMYTQVYVDIGALSWTLIACDMLEPFLREAKRRRLLGRVMFGSDQMRWPEAIALAIDRVNRLDFLTVEEKQASSTATPRKFSDSGPEKSRWYRSILIDDMRPASMALTLLAVVAVSAQPEQGTLRIKVTLADAAQAPTPVRHTLLVSDNPASAAPRQIVTAADGTVVLTLRPGSYIVESDRPVVFGGRAYQWTQVVEIVAGRDLGLDLTADNAEIVPLEALPPSTTASALREDALLSKYQESVVAVWSPTARASGFVVDSRGLIATDGRAVGTATVVEVQLAPTVKVPARVLLSERSRDVAIVRVDPSLVATLPALALACPPSRAPSLDDGQEIASITVPHAGEKELVHGEVTALQPRRVQTDVRLPFGGSGGPVFNDAGAVVGLTSMSTEPDSRPEDAAVVTTVFICEALAASLPMLSGAEPPAATRLPVEPTRPYPVGTLEDVRRGATPNAAVPVMSSSDFDVAFVTPPMVHRARQRSGWTGASERPFTRGPGTPWPAHRVRPMV